jgi:hypothetical protein
MTRQVSRRGDEPSSRDGAGSSDDMQSGDSRKSALGRRALLTRGGVVAAGVVGAGTLGAAVAGPASAQGGDLVLNTANDAGTGLTPTEVDAVNSTTPTFILTNTGIDNEIPVGLTTEYAFSGPNLRLTPSPGSSSSIPNAFEPTPSTVGGDLTATLDGQLWFTHDFTQGASPAGIRPAPVHTEQTANVYAGLVTPIRVLDTRTTAGRANVINPSGNLGSGGLLAKKTIYINLDNLVYFADNVIANFTATQTTGSGFLTVWYGGGTRPATSNINWTAKGVTIANLTSSVVGSYPEGSTSPTYDNVIAIFADTTTHVLMDVLAFTMPGFEYAKDISAVSVGGARADRLQRAQKKLVAENIRNAKRA